MIKIGLLAVSCGLVSAGLPHLLGVSPILGAVLCAGCFLRPRELFAVGLGGILIRDLLLGFSPFTAVRLAGMGLAVWTMVLWKVRPSFRSLGRGLLIASPLFHLTLAVGNWATGTCGYFPRTPAGLWVSIAGSVPYFQRAFLGDLLFAGLFVAAYHLASLRLLVNES